MVKAVVLYGNPEDPDSFERYYAETHRALAKAIPGLERFEAAQGIATPDGGPVPYQCVAELTCEDMDALQAGLRSEQGQAGVNDLPNFATGGVTIFFAEIDWHIPAGHGRGWSDIRTFRRCRARRLALLAEGVA
jgi:uncharacterized protein (TIGR02118 family)